MKKAEEDRTPFQDLSEWTHLTRSPGWIHFIELVKKHRDYCNTQALSHIEKGNDKEAYGFRMRAKDSEVIINQVKLKLKELKGGERSG